MTKIIDLPTTASTDANTFVPVYKNGKTQKVSATVFGGGGSGLGAGGTVVQATSKSTPVTLNKPSGYIRMHNATLNAGASVSFTLNNSFINVGGNPQDCLVVNAYARNNYRVEILGLFGGAAEIRVTNLTGGNLSEVLLVQFQLIKGASA